MSVSRKSIERTPHHAANVIELRLINPVSFSSEAIDICCKRSRNADFAVPLFCSYLKSEGNSVLISSACSQPRSVSLPIKCNSDAVTG